MKYPCDECACSVVVSIDDDLKKADVTKLWTILDSGSVHLDVKIHAECEEHKESRVYADPLSDVIADLRDWITDTYGPLGWDRAHPVAAAMRKLESIE